MPQPGWRSLFWTAFKRSQNAMVLLDDHRRHVEVNGAYLALLSYKRSALIGRQIHDFVEGGRLMSNAEWLALPRADKLGETELVRSDGIHVHVEYAVHPEHVTGRRLILLVALTTSRRRRRHRPPATAEGTVNLTERELEIIEQVSLGRTGPEIAEDLHISHDTVRTHVRNAQDKLGARSRAQLVALTLGEGYLGAHRSRAVA
jgi:PAS domain S-box-containing protein